MDEKTAIKTLSEIRRECELCLRLVLDERTREIYEHQLSASRLAIDALEKQIPKRPIIKAWGAASCPCCGVHLSESLGDGYYKHWTSLKFCDCGQKLVWD